MNFESIIKDMLAAGYSSEEIAKEFTSNLNLMEKKSDREAIIQRYSDMDDPAANYAVVKASENEDWTGKDIEEFYTQIKGLADSLAEVIGKSDEDLICKDLNKFFGTEIFGKKKEEKKETPTNKVKVTLDDDSILRDFLRDFKRRDFSPLFIKEKGIKFLDRRGQVY